MRTIARASGILLALLGTTSALAQTARTVLPIPAEPFSGVVGETIPQSRAALPRPVRAPLGAPGIDHCLVLSRAPTGLRDVLWFTGESGVNLTIATTEPGMQVYDGGAGLPRWQAPAFEAQGWPDAMHHAGFPSVTLQPGQVYSTTTVWKFGR